MNDSDTNPDDERRLVDIKTLAAILGVGERYIRRLVQERRVPFIKLGHYVRFDLQEIWVWVDGFRRPQLRPARLPGRNV